jgi:hypothetical protein
MEADKNSLERIWDMIPKTAPIPPTPNLPNSRSHWSTTGPRSKILSKLETHEITTEKLSITTLPSLHRSDRSPTLLRPITPDQACVTSSTHRNV